MMLVTAALIFWLAMWWLNQRLVAIDPGHNQAKARVINLAVPLIFGLTLFMIWERITNSLPILWQDFQQTFLKAVLAGYILGCGSGFIVALLIDRSPFLQRGLLPLGNFVSACVDHWRRTDHGHVVWF